MHVESHHTPEQLRRLARREAKGRVAVRMLAVASAMQNKTAPQVAAGLGVGRRTAQEWVSRYNLGGVAACATRADTGRQPPLAPAEQGGRRLGSTPARRPPTAGPARCAARTCGGSWSGSSACCLIARSTTCCTPGLQRPVPAAAPPRRRPGGAGRV